MTTFDENGHDTTATWRTQLVGGVDSQGKIRPLAVNNKGEFISKQESTASDNATATNQQTEIQKLESLLAGLNFLLLELQQKTEPGDTQKIAGRVDLGDTGSLAKATDIQAVRDRLPATLAPADRLKVDLPSTILERLNLLLPEGKDITDAPMPAGGTGARGWLSAIWQVISSRLPALVNNRLPIDLIGTFTSTLPSLTTGQTNGLQLSSRGELYTSFVDLVNSPANITTADTSSNAPIVGANNQNLITGNPTNGSAVSANITGESSFALLITGTFAGTLQFERSLDNGVTWTRACFKTR
ncbi:hypothetical protein BZZ01_04970 [Nostocales cyanobacterium HT-58-2]|nr:hypothetical protein BZZ01_04970 [Nostocales cyanobacterium HT-58-2]